MSFHQRPIDGGGKKYWIFYVNGKEAKSVPVPTPLTTATL